jgi:hypothetical protein
MSDDFQQFGRERSPGPPEQQYDGPDRRGDADALRRQGLDASVSYGVRAWCDWSCGRGAIASARTPAPATFTVGIAIASAALRGGHISG